MLVITGFPLSYPNTWWAQAIVKALGGWEMRMQIHHFSGLSLVILSIYHVFCMYRARFSRGKKLKMLPGKSDVDQFFAYIKHTLGLGPVPKFDRYSLKEKFEYWGVVWGMLVMGLTGFILWFPFEAIKFIPLGWVNLASTIHFFEALLATLVILISHFYNVHFTPEWPMQKTWLTGKIPEEKMKEHHPVEYQEMMEAKAKQPTLESDLEY